MRVAKRNCSKSASINCERNESIANIAISSNNEDRQDKDDNDGEDDNNEDDDDDDDDNYNDDEDELKQQEIDALVKHLYDAMEPYADQTQQLRYRPTNMQE